MLDRFWEKHFFDVAANLQDRVAESARLSETFVSMMHHYVRNKAGTSSAEKFEDRSSFAVLMIFENTNLLIFLNTSYIIFPPPFLSTTPTHVHNEQPFHLALHRSFLLPLRTNKALRRPHRRHD